MMHGYICSMGGRSEKRGSEGGGEKERGERGGREKWRGVKEEGRESER